MIAPETELLIGRAPLSDNFFVPGAINTTRCSQGPRHNNRTLARELEWVDADAQAESNTVKGRSVTGTTYYCVSRLIACLDTLTTVTIPYHTIIHSTDRMVPHRCS